VTVTGKEKVSGDSVRGRIPTQRAVITDKKGVYQHQVPI